MSFHYGMSHLLVFWNGCGPVCHSCVMSDICTWSVCVFTGVSNVNSVARFSLKYIHVYLVSAANLYVAGYGSNASFTRDDWGGKGVRSHTPNLKRSASDLLVLELLTTVETENMYLQCGWNTFILSLCYPFKALQTLVPLFISDL